MRERNSTGQNHAAEARRFALVIEWSDEDQVYIVSAPISPDCAPTARLGKRRSQWARRRSCFGWEPTSAWAGHSPGPFYRPPLFGP
jgi:hypothetical protein